MNQYEMKQRAYQSNLKSRVLQVLLYLIDRSNKEHTCFPAVPTIGRELHISISTVKRAMKELVEAGYVVKESRFRAGNGGQTSNLYTLYFPVEKEITQKEIDDIGDNQTGGIALENTCVEEERVETKTENARENSFNNNYILSNVIEHCMKSIKKNIENSKISFSGRGRGAT